MHLEVPHSLAIVGFMPRLDAEITVGIVALGVDLAAARSPPHPDLAVGRAADHYVLQGIIVVRVRPRER